MKKHQIQSGPPPGEAQGGLPPSRKFFAPPGKMFWTQFKSVGHSAKNLSPSQKTLRPPSQAGCGPGSSRKTLEQYHCSSHHWLQYGRRRNANAKPEPGLIVRIEPLLAIISVEKLLIFQLKWVIHMPTYIFCLFKTCALILNSLFYSPLTSYVPNSSHPTFSSFKTASHRIRLRLTLRLMAKGGFTQNPVPAYSPSTVTVRFENRLTCSGMLSHRFRKRPFSRVRLALWSYRVDVH